MRFRKMITLIFMVINRWFPVKFSIWIQREMILGQGTDKKILEIHRELQSDFLSLRFNPLHQPNFWRISRDSLSRRYVLIVTLNVVISALLLWAQLSECLVSARLYDVILDRWEPTLSGKLMEEMGSPSVLLVCGADVGDELVGPPHESAAFSASRRESLVGRCYTPQLLAHAGPLVGSVSLCPRLSVATKRRKAGESRRKAHSCLGIANAGM